MTSATDTAARRDPGSPLATRAAAQRVPRARRRTAVFWLLMLFFVLEYIRPAGIGDLKIQMGFLLLVPVMWLSQSKRPWSRSLTLQTAFVCLCALSVPFASNNFAAYTVTRIMYGNVVVALAITWFLDNRRDFTFAIWFWVAIMAFQATWGVMHKGQGYGSTFGDENDLALGLNTAVPFALIGIQSFRESGKRWICVGLLILLISAIVASLSRGGFLGLIAGVAYWMYSSRNRLRNFSLAAVGGLLFYLLIPAEYKGEVASIQETDSGTADQRLFYWTAATSMWVANPVLGVGAGNSPWNMGTYQPRRNSGRFSEPVYQERDYTMTAVHSAFFQILAETGTVGSVLFVMMIVGHFKTLRQTRRRVQRDPRASPALRRENELYTIALGAATVGFLTSGAFLSVAYYAYPWYFCAFGVAWQRAVQLELARSQALRPAPR
jgi:O-antigen ligase